MNACVFLSQNFIGWKEVKISKDVYFYIVVSFHYAINIFFFPKKICKDICMMVGINWCLLVKYINPCKMKYMT